MIDDLISRIEAALAAGPTPGPWSSGHTQPHTMIYCRDGWAVADAYTHHGMRAKAAQVANATYIAACNPTAIRALLDQRKEQQAEIERLRRALHRNTNLASGDDYNH